MKIKTLLIVTVLLSIVYLTSCAPSLYSQLNARKFDHTIDLRVGDNELYTPTKPKGNCKKDGCFEVDLNWSASIRFRLKANEKWELTEMKICEGEDKTAVCQLESWQTKEFVAYGKSLGAEISPDENGLIRLESESSKPVRNFYLFDFNLNKSDYHYSITACPVGTDDEKECVTLDPPIVNKGKNNIYIN